MQNNCTFNLYLKKIFQRATFFSKSIIFQINAPTSRLLHYRFLHTIQVLKPTVMRLQRRLFQTSLNEHNMTSFSQRYSMISNQIHFILNQNI